MKPGPLVCVGLRALSRSSFELKDWQSKHSLSCGRVEPTRMKQHLGTSQSNAHNIILTQCLDIHVDWPASHIRMLAEANRCS
jgi:hypothetical protein